MVFMVAVWVLIVAGGLFFLLKWLPKTPEGYQGQLLLPGSSALEILKERYARGEIDREEFGQKKQDINTD
ncbi:MAG: SHOCT domain-containing protein [Desulfobacteraceae bacterium]|nr:SHOCT domain-containing protein [Desulfobacteraceae bacterium]